MSDKTSVSDEKSMNKEASQYKISDYIKTKRTIVEKNLLRWK